MEIVNTLDIDGTQWEIKDEVARNNIATINQLLKIEAIADIPIVLNSGYTATTANIQDVQKYGKLYKGLLCIDDISGENIGTTYSIIIGKIDRNVLGANYALGMEYLTNNITRFLLAEGGYIYITESQGINNGNNRLRVPIIWFG